MIKNNDMGKIYKYANIYDKNCTSDNCKDHIIRRVNVNGVLEDYTMEELEKLVDDLGNDKDEDGKIKDPKAFNNASSMLLQYYEKYGYPHKDELINAFGKLKQRPINEQVIDALNDTYDNYEEIKEA